MNKQMAIYHDKSLCNLSADELLDEIMRHWEHGDAEKKLIMRHIANAITKSMNSATGEVPKFT